MPYVAHLPIHKGTHIKNSLDYISREEKVYKVTGINCPVDVVTAMSLFENANYLKEKITKKQSSGDIIAHHYYQSFLPGSVDADEVHKIGIELANIIAPGYMAHIATHIDKDHIHNHIIICSVHPETGYKYRHCWDQYKFVQEQSDALCREAGIPIIEKPRKGNIKSKEYRVIERGDSWKDKLAWDIDDAIKSAIDNSTGKEGFIDYLRSKGYEVNWQNKNISIKLSGNKAVRVDTLAKTYGEKYRKGNIERRLRGEKLNIVGDKQNGDKQLPKHMKYGDTTRFNEYDRYIEWCIKNKIQAELEVQKRSPPQLDIYRSRNKDKQFIVSDFRPKVQSMEEGRQTRKIKSWKDKLAFDIDEAIRAARESKEGKECFVRTLEDKGYIVKYQNKNISIQIPGRKAIRVDTLAKTHGNQYTKENIESRLESTSMELDNDTVNKEDCMIAVKYDRECTYRRIKFFRFGKRFLNLPDKNSKTKDEREIERELEELGRFLSGLLKQKGLRARTIKGRWRIKEEKKERKRANRDRARNHRERGV